MNTSKSLIAGIGSALVIASFSAPVAAGSKEALAACKTEIAGDARFSQYAKVSQNTDEIKRRGRFTKFEIKVNAINAEGAKATWVANCKARNSGKVEELQMVQLGGATDAQFAQAAN